MTDDKYGNKAPIKNGPVVPVQRLQLNPQLQLHNKKLSGNNTDARNR